MIFPLFAALFAAAQPQVAAPAATTELSCDYIERDGTTRHLASPGIEVLRLTAADAPFAPNIPPGAALICLRTQIVPAPNDWKPPVAGFPLAILEVSADRRLATLEYYDGEFHWTMRRGELTPEEDRLVRERLAAFRSAAGR